MLLTSESYKQDTTTQRLEVLSLTNDVLLAKWKLKLALEWAKVLLAMYVPEHPDAGRTTFSLAGYGSCVSAIRRIMHGYQSKLVHTNDEVATNEKCKRLLQICPEAAGLLKQVLSMTRSLSELTDRVQQAAKDIDVKWQPIQ